MYKQLLSEIGSSRDIMSPVEKRIADVILADPRKFTAYSMTELASVADVSQGSIINFSNKYSGGGFPALKLQIAAGLSEHESKRLALEGEPFNVAQSSDSVKDVFEKTADGVAIALSHTSAINDDGELLRVADRILAAKKVEIYGVFQSAIVANDFYYQLIQLGIPASFVSDVLTCSLSASMLDKDSLVIAISSSGQTKDIVDAVSLAKENGVPVVLMTANRISTLAKLADEVIVAAPSGISQSTRSNEVRISELVLVDALCAYLRSRIDETGEKRYFNIKNILNSHSVDD